LILGGGVAGIACAVGLRGTGLQVMLVERLPVLGGRARSWVDTATGDRIDIGPHILLSEYPNLLSLLDMLGTRDRIVWQTGELITLAGQNGFTPMRLHRLPPPLHLLPAMLKARDVRLRDKFVPEAALARVIHRQVHRIPMAIPAPHPGTESARPGTSTPFERLLLAGDWTRTQIPASMESAARSGFLAAEKIRAGIGKPCSLAKLPRETEGFAGWVRRGAERWRHAK
jgi:uncharacterized protein with NAD-binding domain and iron-sulfur cluster